MKIAIAKPDFHAAGGFEIVVERIASGLRARGHQVELVQVDVDGSPISDLGVAVDARHVALFRDFFFHLNMVARFERLDVGAYDVVLCTQPASWAVRHPRKVVLFYHHTRTFYDLFEAIESVRGHDVALHHLAAFIVRDVDGFYLTPETPILAGSRRIKQRLADHNGLDASVEVFSAGVDDVFFDYAGPISFGSPLCIGRHEFPKRTELFLHAMLHVTGLQGRLLGSGSFTDRLKSLDGWLRLQHAAPPPDAPPTRSGCHIDDDRLWRDVAIHHPLDRLRTGEAAAAERGIHPRVTFLGRLAKEEVLRIGALRRLSRVRRGLRAHVPRGDGARQAGDCLRRWRRVRRADRGRVRWVPRGGDRPGNRRCNRTAEGSRVCARDGRARPRESQGVYVVEGD
jgi:hypothetical protein